MSDTTGMSLAEQLSALMDGQLAEEQARFLRRRLEHDAELRAAWSRLQLASACLRGHAVQPMALDCDAIRAPATAVAAAGRGGWTRWIAAASVAALAVALAPRLLAPSPSPVSNPARPAIVAAAARALPSPASADLVARRSVDARPAPPTSTPVPVRRGALVAASGAANASPLPLQSQSESPADFPLVDTGRKAWPRSDLPAVGSDPQLEAYLVRHNQMLANDGLGGFVPYVDVVARDPANSAADLAPAPAAGQEPGTP